MEEKQQGLTPEERLEIREMVEKYYGVELGPDTPETEAFGKKLQDLWNEQRQKGKSSGRPESKDTTPTG